MSNIYTEYKEKKQAEKDYSSQVKNICDNWMIGLASRKKDAQLISNVINLLAKEGNMDASRAMGVLSDAIIIIPHISTL